MIDHGRRLIFIHIPKTAGISIYKALGVTDQPGHKTIDDYPEHRAEYFSFAFVRNPWARALSSYLYIRKGGRGWIDDVEASKRLLDCPSFEDFATHIEDYQERLAQLPAQGNGSIRHYPHLLPQSFWTHDADLVPILDFVGRYETLETDLNVVMGRTGEHVSLETTNTTEHGPYQDYYSAASRRAVAKAYAIDVEQFGYRF